jgi:hypothetical protein
MASDTFLYIKTINMDFTMRDKDEAEVASLLKKINSAYAL